MVDAVAAYGDDGLPFIQRLQVGRRHAIPFSRPFSITNILVCPCVQIWGDPGNISGCAAAADDTQGCLHLHFFADVIRHKFCGFVGSDLETNLDPGVPCDHLQKFRADSLKIGHRLVSGNENDVSGTSLLERSG